MLKQFKYRDVTWIDLESPTSAEVQSVVNEYHLHPVLASELENPDSRAKINVFSEVIYIGLHVPRGLLGRRSPDDHRSPIEIDFLVGPNFIITNHYELNDVLRDFSKIFETDFILKKNQDKINGGLVFFYIMRELYQALAIGLDALNSRLRATGEEIFAGRERQMVKILSDINYDLLDGQWALQPHANILHSLEPIWAEFFGAKLKSQLPTIILEANKVWAMVENNHRILLDLRQTNESLLSIKTNETMRILTVIAFIFFPLAIISQTAVLYGSPTFWPAILLMLLALGLTYWTASNKKWL